MLPELREARRPVYQPEPIEPVRERPVDRTEGPAPAVDSWDQGAGPNTRWAHGGDGVDLYPVRYDPLWSRAARRPTTPGSTPRPPSCSGRCRRGSRSRRPRR